MLPTNDPSITDPCLAAKLAAAADSLRRLGRVAVAFSGGVDSTFVLKLAVDALGPDGVLAVTADSPSLARAEQRESRELAAQLGVRQVLLDPGEFGDANYLANPSNRCYYCKTALYDAMSARLEEWGVAAIVNGTNTDDLGDWRPGLRAAAEHRVFSPCVEANLTKDEIRRLSASLGLPTHDKPAAPCLSSRIPYGQPVTRDKLQMIERAETALRELGFRECRVRHHEDDPNQEHSPFARVELPPARLQELNNPVMRQAIEGRLREIGYTGIEIDPRGFRSGSLNELIALGLP